MIAVRAELSGNRIGIWEAEYGLFIAYCQYFNRVGSNSLNHLPSCDKRWDNYGYRILSLNLSTVKHSIYSSTLIIYFNMSLYNIFILIGPYTSKFYINKLFLTDFIQSVNFTVKYFHFINYYLNKLHVISYLTKSARIKKKLDN